MSTKDHLDILFEDADLLVVNKPPDLLSVPGRGPDRQDAIQTRAANRYPQILVVHRLDCATSGIMLLAKTKAAQQALNRQFHDRKVEKEYRAITAGPCANDYGEIQVPLITDWPNRPRQKICYETGKSALTRYQRISQNGELNHLRLFPVTGRSHQLRVHMMALGMAIVGDNLYAEERIAAMSPRLLLHAHRLVIKHPAFGDTITIESPVPF